MNPDDVYAVEDYSPETLAALSAALECSTSREHFVYREAELDDLWRVLDTALAAARHDTRERAAVERLVALRAVTMEAHDLVGAEGRPRDAAALLRAAVDRGGAGA